MTSGNEQKLYCPSCGENVPTYSIPVAGGTEVRCATCGLPLSVESGPPLRGLGAIMVTDDDKFFRVLLSDLLTERGLTTEVITCDGGPEFLTRAVERFRDRMPIRLAILDIIMQPLDGVSSALALRAVERGLQAAHPIPFLFLSAARLDDTLTKLLALCRPAVYLNKGQDATPDKLGPRLDKVIERLLAQEKPQA
jgi:CheY-like chemotaxis protein